MQHRVMQLRRACERRDENEKIAKDIWRKYDGLKEPATMQGNEGLYGEPAPHPNLGSRIKIKNESNPKGPIGFLLQSVNMLGGVLDQNFVLCLSMLMAVI